MPRKDKTVNRRTLLKTVGIGGVSVTAGCLRGDQAGDSGDSGDSGGSTDSGSEDTDDSGGSTDSGGGEPIVIGALEPFEGPFATYANFHRAGLEFAIEEINSNGGVLGRDLEVNFVDTGADPSEAATVFSRMVNEEGIVAATGPVSSDVGIRLRQSANEEEVPLLPHITASDAVLTKESRYVFRVGIIPAPAIVQGISGLAADRGYDNTASVIADYAWGSSFRKSIEMFFPEDVNVDFATAPVGEDDFTPYLRELEGDYGMFLGTGHPPGITSIYKQLLQLDRTYDIYMGSTATAPAYYSAVGEDVTKGLTYFHLVDYESDEFTEVAQRFADTNNAYFSANHAIGYITAHLLKTAIEEAGEVNPVAIADTLRNISFETMFGNPIEYTEWGELKNQVLTFSQIETEAPEYYPDGEFRPTQIFQTDPIPAFDPSEF